MLSGTDYATMTTEELLAAEKKIKSQDITTAVFIGMLIGIAVWSATHKGFILPVILLISAYLMGSRHAQNMKGIQAEISRRDTVR